MRGVEGASTGGRAQASTPAARAAAMLVPTVWGDWDRMGCSVLLKRRDRIALLLYVQTTVYPRVHRSVVRGGEGRLYSTYMHVRVQPSTSQQPCRREAQKVAGQLMARKL